LPQSFAAATKIIKKVPYNNISKNNFWVTFFNKLEIKSKKESYIS